ncbi:MAG: HAMP domain-containing protein [Nitrospirae bacterium]|nr:HAMP domain-containing protein [Nitrospirota bacterium]
MFRNSLTAKIIVSVAITIAVVIGIFTYLIVGIQTDELMNRAKRNGIFISHLIYQHISEAMLRGGREEVQEFFPNIRKSKDVLRVFVFDEGGEIVFSSRGSEVGRKADDFHRRLFGRERGNLINFQVSKDHKIFSIVTPVKNKAGCQRCHGKERPVLGALGIDISLIPAETEIRNNRNWIIFFAFIVLLLVSAVISVLVVVLVKRPIRNLMRTMTEVERGNLKAKVNVRSRDELGRLGKSFNSMITRLERANVELQRYYERQMQQAEKLATIGELASGIAHEIKNPLSGIGAAIQVLSEEFNLRTTHREIVDEIMQQLERLNKTTRDLLSFARPAEPRFLAGDLNEIINKAGFFIRKRAEKQNVLIREDLKQDIPHIFLDPEQMQQVFLNIMLNALQAMPKGGELHIKTSQKEDTVEVAFEDTGKGISPEQLRKIFNPFFTTRHRGTGLGLSICRKIVESHGGSIKVESEPGKGTIFTVILPVKEVKD